ncbi:hypothetical protein CB1_001113002 [Camelus ferus]|nr:hypothetical protein CB1_001113002 [Camelus ferus]
MEGCRKKGLDLQLSSRGGGPFCCISFEEAVPPFMVKEGFAVIDMGMKPRRSMTGPHKGHFEPHSRTSVLATLTSPDPLLTCQCSYFLSYEDSSLPVKAGG